jgi:hypothetical protein
MFTIQEKIEASKVLRKGLDDYQALCGFSANDMLQIQILLLATRALACGAPTENILCALRRLLPPQ